MACTMLVIMPPTFLSMRLNSYSTDAAISDVLSTALTVAIIIRNPHPCHCYCYHFHVDHTVTSLNDLNAPLRAEWWCSLHTLWTKQISWETG
jgi:hypothetical protein